MKCKECRSCVKGWFASKPDSYVCIAVPEPFVINNINAECTQYEYKRNKKSFDISVDEADVSVDEAIEYWEGLLRTFSKQLETEKNYFGRMHLKTTIDVLITTINTLRESGKRTNNF